MPLIRKPQPDEVTNLLLAWSDGDRQSFDKLSVSVQAALRKRARTNMRREGPAHTLEPTVLVNEAYLRLIDRYRLRRESPQ